MRVSVLVGKEGYAWECERARKQWVAVLGTFMRADTARVLLSDRVANGESFEGERLVRLPRRFSRVGAIYQHRYGFGTHTT